GDKIMLPERGPGMPPAGSASAGAARGSSYRLDPMPTTSGSKLMLRRWPAPVPVSAFVIAAMLTASEPGASAQATSAVDETFFVEKVYPVLHAAQCERCHSDNGVASESRLEFPEPEASRDGIAAFGLSLVELVDRRNPDQSLLLRKP